MPQLSRRHTSSLVRSFLLACVSAGWLTLALGAVRDSGALVAVGAAVAGGGNILMAVLMLGIRPARDGRFTASRNVQRQLRRELDVARRELDRLRDDNATQRRALTALEQADDAARIALVETRSMVSKLSDRLRMSAISDEALRRLENTDVAQPLLSIAIPSFNRPDKLAECLASVEAEVGACGTDLVEVCITDDASTDPDTIAVLVGFAERLGYMSLRQHRSNIGLDRNLLAACEPCRGEYVLILGNDDCLVPGALRMILEDLGSVPVPVHLYEKERIDQEGSPRPAVIGSSPIALADGEGHRFDSLIDAASFQGFLSTFGFISQVVFRRRPFVAVDAGPYLDLTMYPQVFALIEAFAEQPVYYRNAAIVLHRTPTPSQKLAEAIGRREEPFMAGGTERLSRYFGTTLAASFQRLIDRGIHHDVIAEAPERLMSTHSLVEWIVRNRAIDPSLDGQLDHRVVSDAERLMATLRPAANDRPTTEPGTHTARISQHLVPGSGIRGANDRRA